VALAWKSRRFAVSSPYASLKILVVDDNAHMRAIVVEVLGRVGVKEVRAAPDGSSALDILATWNADAAIIDCRMSPMDGIEFTKRMRALGSPNTALPIVMMTGYADQARVVDARDAGVSEILAKPISAKSLLERLNAAVFAPRPFVRTESYAGPSRRRTSRESGQKRRLLDKKPVHI
jgi:CheY-like chemotaxis protein